MRIRLTSLPQHEELEEFDLRRFRVGELYDLPPHFASVLLISGYAELAPPLPLERYTAADSARPKARKPRKAKS